MSVGAPADRPDFISRSFDVGRDADGSRPLLVAVGVLTLFTVYASIAKVDRVVRGQGRIVPSASTQTIQHLEGGIISQVLVSEGQSVKKGQLLARVRDTDASDALNENQVKGLALKARVARLEAEASGAGSVRMPEGLTAATPEMAAELAAFRARQATQRETSATAYAILAQKNAELGEATQKLANYRAEHETAVKQLQLVANLRSAKAASQIELLDAQAREQRLNSLIQETSSNIPALKAAIDEATSRVAQSQAQFRSEAGTELTAAKVELMRSDVDRRGAADRLNRTDVRAPLDGIINHILVKTEGGVVRPGEPLMELTPVGGNVVVEGRFKPGDRGELRPGLRAAVKISAYDYAALGSLVGRVDDVSADTLADERGERYYRVKVTVPPSSVKPGETIYPGMTTTVDVVVGRRPVIAYLLSPILHFADSAFKEAR
jgi:adhesin transport system membrane fusion protein